MVEKLSGVSSMDLEESLTIPVRSGLIIFYWNFLQSYLPRSRIYDGTL